MSLFPDQIPNPGTIGNGQRLRFVMANMSQRLGVIAQGAGGKTSTVQPVLDMLGYMQADLVPAMVTAPTYPTKLFANAAAVTAVNAQLPTDAPSVPFAPVGSELRSELIRMLQAVAAADVAVGGKSGQADVVFSMIEALLTDIFPYKP